jgi:predicted glycoside hydrolase/deacetylase ChbG (UPF0249 family)
MVFMGDSERAAKLATSENLETGLHINLVLPYDAPGIPEDLRKSQMAAAAFFRKGPWTQILYNPFISRHVSATFRAQLDEYHRLFGQEPAHFNGHKHFHLSLNMIIRGVLPAGSAVRRSFAFFQGEKNWLNRCYRELIDAWLLRRHVSTDAFFSLPPAGDWPRLTRIVALARTQSVEIMVHPWNQEQYDLLTGARFHSLIASVDLGGFSALHSGGGAFR